MATLRAAGCVFAEDEARLLTEAAGSAAELSRLVAARVSGLPLEPLIGWTEFMGRQIQIEPGVFVPRQRTRYLVQRAAALLRPHDTALDLCCGSGAVGAVLGDLVEGLELYAVDVDPVAVRCARRNLPGRTVLMGDLFAPLPETLHGRLHVVVANAPYVPSGALRLMPPEARLHEPATALDGGADGLAVHRRIATEAPGWLAPGGHLLVETSSDQAAVAAEIFRDVGLAPRVQHSARADATVVAGRLSRVRRTAPTRRAPPRPTRPAGPPAGH